ncbi:MAG: NADH-quinone oxidoreductase subunit N [Phycisphaeraceae bacterium]|nr:NADH-quinone oxidoreductase subunit N [Phycisphaeraceae bacterium]
MNPITAKLMELGPEVALFIGACLCLAVGLSRSRENRKLAASIAAMALVASGIAAVLFTPPAFRDLTTGPLPMALYLKPIVAAIGILLLLFAVNVPDRLATERAIDEGRLPFDPANVMTGEFYAFFLLSLAGVMLCSSAGDLVWLFLALELTSLPTYVMVAVARDRADAGEAAVKYFFLGAFAAAIFLYGFTLIYGATGLTTFDAIRQHVMEHGTSPMLLLGVGMAVIGIAFKIAAFPMHFYVADVYQGATTPVTAMLAFIPKTAGFVALILVLTMVSGVDARFGMPPVISGLLWIMAAATMTVGNVLGLLQNNVKRMLAYSSVAHSGYMLVGLLALGSASAGSLALGSGASAVLFYLVAYGLGNLAAFAVLGCLQHDGDEAQSLEDLSGLVSRRPALAVVMLLANLSLIGLPPMIGFVGKVYLFGSAISQGYILLVVVAVLNSAISAVYYLRMIAACYFGQPGSSTTVLAPPARVAAAITAATLALILGLGGDWLAQLARDASPRPMVSTVNPEDLHPRGMSAYPRLPRQPIPPMTAPATDP